MFSSFKEKLKEVNAADVEKIEKAVPAKTQAEPKKKRKILVFWKCDGFFHKCIPVANKCIELMGKKSGAYEAVIPATASEQMDNLTPEKLKEFDAVLFNNTTRLKTTEGQTASAT